MQATSELTFRPVTHDDRQAVEDICEYVFEGNDYVPSKLSSYLQDPQVHVLGGVVEGQLVCLAVLTRMCGSVAWMSGVRVHHDHRRRRLGRRIATERLALARRLGLDTARSTVNPQVEPARRLALSCGMSCVHSLQLMRVQDHVRRGTRDALGAWLEQRSGHGSAREAMQVLGPSQALQAMAHDAFVLLGNWTCHRVRELIHSPDELSAAHIVVCEGGTVSVGAWGSNTSSDAGVVYSFHCEARSVDAYTRHLRHHMRRLVLPRAVDDLECWCLPQLVPQLEQCGFFAFRTSAPPYASAGVGLGVFEIDTRP